jgi:hypothetical protein
MDEQVTGDRRFEIRRASGARKLFQSTNAMNNSSTTISPASVPPIHLAGPRKRRSIGASKHLSAPGR